MQTIKAANLLCRPVYGKPRFAKMLTELKQNTTSASTNFELINAQFEVN